MVHEWAGLLSGSLKTPVLYGSVNNVENQEPFLKEL